MKILLQHSPTYSDAALPVVEQPPLPPAAVSKDAALPARQPCAGCGAKDVAVIAAASAAAKGSA
jgi:hypothetical protein